MSNTKQQIIDVIMNADDETLNRMIAFIESSIDNDETVVTTFR